ncbi:DUF5719 family protein [Microbacterium sp. JZ31]|uniref:DUF5719 family protein n=1 Tax=Microbacterium sp. JZ31 TaxID=1906274 RepID=UPI0019321909|nr:DUF5719 family protein [Microbacterium sp. JZ31]
MKLSDLKLTGAQRTLGGRVILGAVTGIGAIAAVTAAAALPWPAVATPPASVEVMPAPAETVLSCDGPVLALGRAVEDAGALAVATESRITVGNDRDEEPDSDVIAQPTVAGEAATTRYVQRPEGREAVSAAAASSASVSDSDLAGFTASACRPPQMESWIVGGETETGTTGVVLVANPGDVDATVQITVYGVAGPVTPPSGAAVPVPARTQVALPLAGLAGGEQSPVLRITATGAPVRASLQSSLIRTLDPGGIDSQSAVRPAATQVIPGVRIVGGAAETEGAATIARLLSESDTAGTITVTAQDGSTAREPEPVELTAGAPLEVDLGSLESGEYTVTVTSDAPVVAAVWQTTGFGADADFAWNTAAPAISESTLVAVPRGPDPTIGIANPSDEAVTVSIAGQGDDPEEVAVPAGATAVVEVDDQRLYTIDPRGASVHAAIGFAGDAGVASIAVWPDAAHPQPVVVYP